MSGKARQVRRVLSRQVRIKLTSQARSGKARQVRPILTRQVWIRINIIGYSDFHNLMGFTSKKMPNNIL
jgi:hypothetical protein